VVGVTFDTNIYVSALEFGGINARLLGMARAGAFRLDVSDAILNELVSLLRDDFRWDGYRLHFAREQIVKMANRVIPSQTIVAIKEDPDDNRILECGVAAGSGFIVTYDNDLLRLGEYKKIKIIRAVDFVQSGLRR
jgi:putative PIN family toxin of toxin-antitoxin system